MLFLSSSWFLRFEYFLSFLLFLFVWFKGCFEIPRLSLKLLTGRMIWRLRKFRQAEVSSVAMFFLIRIKKELA